MKITPNTDLSVLLSSSKPRNPPPQNHTFLSRNLAPRKPPRRETARTPRVSAKKEGTSAVRRPGPPTPLLRWKYDDERERDDVSNATCKKSSEGSRRSRRGKRVSFSSRKLGAALWRLQSPVVGTAVGSGGSERRSVRKGEDRQGSKPKFGHGGDQLSSHHGSRGCCSGANDQLRSPCSINGTMNGYFCELQPSFHFSNYAMEGATKWDPVCAEAPNENPRYLQLHDSKLDVASMAFALQAELQQARTRIEELKTERKSSKKKLEHFLKKLSEERAAWRSREHEKIRAFICDIKADLNRERKKCRRLEIINSKLVNELAEAKLSAKRYMQDYEKERKARELIEEVCDELVKEIQEDKAEVQALKNECLKVREEVEDERKMLQMAEVWREERVQMKLVDAKVTLEDKYSQMNMLMMELENFMRSRTVSSDLKEMREAAIIHHAATSIKVQDIKEFTYEPPNPGDIFSAFEEIAIGESNERDIEPSPSYSPPSRASKMHTVSPEVNNLSRDNIHRLSNVYANQNSDIEDDSSGWETVSQIDDRGSSYSPDGSVPSLSRMRQDSNISWSCCTDWEENAGDETRVNKIAEVSSVQAKQFKKVSSISRLWRSCPNNGGNCKIISVEGNNGRISNEDIVSPDGGSGKGGLSLLDMVGQWSSPDSANPHVGRGMKGCIEWPRGMQKNGLKAKHLEGKIQLRQVLKQKI
ncbi:hypothetical protein Nepgr_007579 [Nepenthes gracilis]|uniref:Uncharacterized protein n=1 Tax=Nepenthes gracilis TaxID=150966 RepID=A0AAD3S7I4_NEPGR|nr:hypothetical protein Nepgr_007579 [Nepenthes gracilis]